MVIIDTITGLIAPNICLSCSSEGSVLCDRCIREYFQPLVPRCAGCFKLSQGSKVCPVCKKWLPLNNIFVSGVHEGINENLVKALKFEYKRQASKPIAKMMAQSLENQNDENLLLCPIPTAPSRIRERGFDHAKLITKELSREINIPIQSLLNRKSNIRQLGSTRSNRIKQMSQEFYCNNFDVKGKNILLVDDVMTSGATLSAAASVLKRSGAKSVSAVVFARQT